MARLSKNAADKLKQAVRQSQASRTGGQRGGSVGPRARPIEDIRITSTTKSGGYYPAKRIIWNETDEDWDDDDDMWAMDLNGAALEASNYPAVIVGSVNDRPLASVESNFPDPALAVVIDIITNVCPIFDTISGQTVITGLTLETTPTTLPGGSSIDDPTCEDDPLECCGEACGICEQTPRYWKFTIAGVTDGTCTDCNEVMNGSFTVGWNGGCAFLATAFAGAGCFGGGEQWRFAYNPVGTGGGFTDDTWSLSTTDGATVIILYELAGASFNCLSANALAKISSSGECTNWPATVTLTPSAGP